MDENLAKGFGSTTWTGILKSGIIYELPEKLMAVSKEIDPIMNTQLIISPKLTFITMNPAFRWSRLERTWYMHICRDLYCLGQNQFPNKLYSSI